MNTEGIILSEIHEKFAVRDKTIIYIDSDVNTGNAVYNDTSVYDLYVDILEPIRSVTYIKIIRCSIILNPEATLNGNVINDDDPIYVHVNDYNRVTSVINGNTVKCFDIIHIAKTKTYSIKNNANLSPTIGEVAYINEYQQSMFDANDTTVYSLNPVEPNLRRFNIRLYDKNDNIINKSDITSFKMTLCIYSNPKKFT